MSEDSQHGYRQYFLIRGRTDRCEPSAINRLVRLDDGSGWLTVRDDGDGSYEDLAASVRSQFIEWIDTLGQESAVAQNLKQPITCWEKIRPDGPKAYSPVKIVDWIYLIVENICTSDGTIFEPNAFLRFGCRSLFLEREGQLVKRESTFCALDFYCRLQRQGIGLLLFSEALNHHNISASHVAFDRPTSAMVDFLQKHFSLSDPVLQHNRFVIFSHFFDDVEPQNKIM